MDKKNTVIGVLLLAAAFAAMQFLPKPPPPAPRPPAAAATSVEAATPTNPSAVPAASTVAAANTNQMVAPLAQYANGTAVTTLANEFVEVRFTSSGGAIRDVALKKYPAVQDQPAPFILNALHADPMLAFVGFPGLGRDVAFQLISHSATEVVYRAVVDGSLEVTRRYVLPPDKSPTTDPYQLRHETTFRNIGQRAAAPTRVSLALGTAAPASAFDLPHLTTGYSSNDKQHFTARTELEASSGFLGMGVREAKREIQSAGPIAWASVTNQFFATILTPDAPGSAIVTRRVKLIPDESPVAYGITGIAQFDLPAIEPAAEVKLGANFYVGPKEYRRLANTDVFKLDQDKVMQFGFFRFFSQLLNTLMTWMHGLVPNWGIAIILTTLALKIVTLPLTLKASKSMKRMQKFAPEMKLIREKYKDNPAKQQSALMDLYKQHKINPLGGCIPMLIPMPFFFGFFTMLQGTAELRFAPFLWARDLSMPDTVGYILGSFPINIFPLLLGVTMIVQMQLTPQPNIDKAQATMMKIMPIIFTFFCYTFSCALSLYSTVNGLFTIVQQLYINRMKDDEPTPVAKDGLKNVTPWKKKKG